MANEDGFDKQLRGYIFKITMTNHVGLSYFEWILKGHIYDNFKFGWEGSQDPP